MTVLRRLFTQDEEWESRNDYVEDISRIEYNNDTAEVIVTTKKGKRVRWPDVDRIEFRGVDVATSTWLPNKSTIVFRSLGDAEEKKRGPLSARFRIYSDGYTKVYVMHSPS